MNTYLIALVENNGENSQRDDGGKHRSTDRGGREGEVM